MVYIPFKDTQALCSILTSLRMLLPQTFEALNNIEQALDSAIIIYTLSLAHILNLPGFQNSQGIRLKWEGV
jgi:hypothetical protein